MFEKESFSSHSSNVEIYVLVIFHEVFGAGVMGMILLEIHCGIGHIRGYIMAAPFFL